MFDCWNCGAGPQTVLTFLGGIGCSANAFSMWITNRDGTPSDATLFDVFYDAVRYEWYLSILATDFSKENVYPLTLWGENAN